ncbi:MAG: hypothetical protein AAF567_24080 [Actinomycetota bacterium]
MTSTDMDRDDPSSDTVWCFQCGRKYDADVAECPECGVPTIDQAPSSADQVGDEDEDQIAYEFHEWTGQGRSILDGMLTRSHIPHAWQGATLIVREEDEELVDSAVAETEIVAMPTLDLTQETMVYELDELDNEQHARLLRRLGDDGISHAFDRNGDLFVYEKDEERVDGLFEGLDESDASEREFGPGVEGADPAEIMSELFIAAGRLRKKPNDAKGVVGLVTNADIAGQLTLPYGMTGDVWGTVVDVSADLADVLKGEKELIEGTISDVAGHLHDLLRTMV